MVEMFPIWDSDPQSCGDRKHRLPPNVPMQVTVGRPLLLPLFGCCIVYFTMETPPFNDRAFCECTETVGDLRVAAHGAPSGDHLSVSSQLPDGVGYDGPVPRMAVCSPLTPTVGKWALEADTVWCRVLCCGSNTP